MPVPDFDEGGFLPPGVHFCTLDEVKRRFGLFQRSDRRPNLFNSLLGLMADVQRTDLFVAVVLDGSFVTAAATPNDIDLILVLRRTHDWNRDPLMHEYNVLSRRRLRRRPGLDVFLAVDGDAGFDEMVAFFGEVREHPDVRKGILRIEL